MDLSAKIFLTLDLLTILVKSKVFVCQSFEDLSLLYQFVKVIPFLVLGTFSKLADRISPELASK